MLITHYRSLTIGYRYWTTTLNRRQGVRHIGAELVGVMDDFGNLVYAEGAR